MLDSLFNASASMEVQARQNHGRSSEEETEYLGMAKHMGRTIREESEEEIRGMGRQSPHNHPIGHQMGDRRMRINFHKSEVIPMNLEDSRAHGIFYVLNFPVGTLPFRYLGLPLHF
jgi:hypothetical protein